MKNLLERLIESIRFWEKIRYTRKYSSPEVKEAVEDFLARKKEKVDILIKEEKKTIDELKNSYDFKCFEHFRKIEFLKYKHKGSDFLGFCKFEIYYDKKRWTRGPFIRFFHTPQDFIWTKFKKLLLFFSALFAFKFGFINGFKDSQLFDEVKENIVDIRTEDQLLEILLKRKIPVLVLYYNPAERYSFEMQLAQGQFIEKWGEEFVLMAKVNCKYNVDLCMKKANYLTTPQYELMYPPYEEINELGEETKKYPILPCKYNRSIEGIEGFLMEQSIIPDKYNALLIINNAMRKYI